MQLCQLRNSTRHVESVAEPQETWDLIVVGLGTAGAIAAVAAARHGLRVLGLDRHTVMGGVGTGGAVIGYYFGSRGGVYERLDEQARATEQEVFTPSHGVNAEGKQYVLEREALQAGATLRYETTITGVLLEGRTVKGLACFSPERGSYTAGARIVIDGTGNAELARWIGAELRGGRAFDGQPQPFSNPLVRLDGKRVRGFYTDSGYVRPEQPASMSAAIVDSALLSTHLRDTYTEEERFLRVAPQLGVREGPFIVGEDNVTLASFLDDDYTREPVFIAYSNIDNHSKDVAFESDLQRDWTVVAGLWGLKFTVPIPLGALIPQGFDGLLVAGRALAVDHDMASCVRMKRDMQQCGEAAAAAAYLAIKRDLPLAEVPYAELAPLLRESGCLPERHKVYFEPRVAAGEPAPPAIEWLTEPEDIRTGLAGDKPGIAIWSARRLGEAIRQHLRQWLQTEQGGHLQRHSAFALALLGDEAAAPVLREMVAERDPFVPRTSLKYNQVRGYTAVYLLGKLADREAASELIALLHTREAFRFDDANREFLSDERDLRFQYVSNAVTALARIGDRHTDLRDRIARAFARFRDELDGTLIISFKGTSEIRHVMDDKLAHYTRQAAARWREERDHAHAAAAADRMAATSSTVADEDAGRRPSRVDGV
ncbi:FAD-dependent oxidoreductase [Paenibacillus sp. IB182496]|uniref:FAD-dependent oxidoreductase n=1 Tax=Paenibacillus sabuli TaxID=2772509 RepID=A0A927GTZ4_9BACL|nr:FAD-dependent oxidoreductase [Paenibacillus sabuli]MBD2847816.1 FAD-dependent oxidoreductase [Paenibacillus sabuli]